MNALRKLWKTIRRMWQAVGAHMPERVYVWWLATRIVFSRDYSACAKAVRKVAIDPSIRDLIHAEAAAMKRAEDPAAVQELINRMRVQPEFAEDLFRVMEAREWTDHHLHERRRRSPSVAVRNLAVELAYMGYKRRRR